MGARNRPRDPFRNRAGVVGRTAQNGPDPVAEGELPLLVPVAGNAFSGCPRRTGTRSGYPPLTPLSSRSA